MDTWPAITEPLLRERQAMSDDEFFVHLAGLCEAIGTRELPDDHYDRAVGYPWGRPPGSCVVTADGVEDVADEDETRKRALLAEYADDPSRVPLLAYGANASPERLALKLEHLPEGDREALILAAELEDFDVAGAAQPPLFSSIAATLVASPGTRVRVAVLFLTPLQFTTLWWTELSYKVGALSDVVVRTGLTAEPLTRVIAFVSRYGTLVLDGVPAAMAAIPAVDRRWPGLTQLELMEAVAGLTLGGGAGAHDVVRSAYERPAAFLAEHLAALRASSVPFADERWEELPA